MESKRRSRLSGRQPSSRESYRMLADWQEGAAGRVATTAQTRATEASYRAAEDARGRTEASRAGMEETMRANEARMAEYAASLNAARESYPSPSFEMPSFEMPSTPDYSAINTAMDEQNKQYEEQRTALQWRIDHPYGEILDPNDPRLQGTPIVKTPPTGGTLGPTSQGPDIPAGTIGTPAGPVPGQTYEGPLYKGDDLEYQNYLRYLWGINPKYRGEYLDSSD